MNLTATQIRSGWLATEGLESKLSNSLNLTPPQVSSLVSAASVEVSPRDYKAPTQQLIAFCALAILYGARTDWAPTERIAPDTRSELSETARKLGIEKVAYQTFVVHMRRMVRKFCEGAGVEEQFLKVQTARDEQAALLAITELLATKNIFTAAHMRTWAGMESMEPLELSRHRNEDRIW